MITKELLHSLFEYRDGELYHRKAIGPKKAGAKAGSRKADGVSHVRVEGSMQLVHRMVFLMHHGYLPEMVDHINRDRSDNRIENLRAATHAQNAYNSIARVDSTSKIKNVNYNSRLKKWQVRVQANKQRFHAGCFDTLEKAEKMAIELRNKLHGEFARHGNLMTAEEAKAFVATLP